MRLTNQPGSWSKRKGDARWKDRSAALKEDHVGDQRQEKVASPTGSRARVRTEFWESRWWRDSSCSSGTIGSLMRRWAEGRPRRCLKTRREWTSVTTRGSHSSSTTSLCRLCAVWSSVMATPQYLLPSYGRCPVLARSYNYSNVTGGQPLCTSSNDVTQLERWRDHKVSAWADEHSSAVGGHHSQM